MRILEQRMAQVRAVLRRAAARTGRTDPSRVAPERLVLRLDDGDLPGALGEGDPLSLEVWRRLLVTGVEWLGPVTVTVISHRADHAELPELVRFANRLGCWVELQTGGSGMDDARAHELTDVGLARARVLVAGVSEEVHKPVVGSPVVEATGAVLGLVQARADRGAPLDIEVAIPWQGAAHTEVRAVIGWARQVGADGFRILAPWRAHDLPADPELLDQVRDEPGPFHRTPSATFDEIHAMVAASDGEPGAPRHSGPARRRRMRCPAGGQRVEVTAHGSVWSCPFKAPIGQVGSVAGTDWTSVDLRRLWQGAGAHLAAIRSCDRMCAHVELAPRPILDLQLFLQV